MNQDPIPRKDSDFDNWVRPFVAYVALNGSALNVKTALLAQLSGLLATWSLTYAATTNPATVTSTAVTAKNEARAAFEVVLRPLLRQIQADPATTDDMRTAMNIRIPSGTHTRAAVPTTAPQLHLGTGQRLAHVLDIHDVTTPHSKAKPAGVKGCEIWAKVGAPAPTDVSQMQLMGTPSHTPHTLNYTGAQAGQPVTYWPRWINTHDETGPWGDPITGTIPG